MPLKVAQKTNCNALFAMRTFIFAYCFQFSLGFPNQV